MHPKGTYALWLAAHVMPSTPCMVCCGVCAQLCGSQPTTTSSNHHCCRPLCLQMNTCHPSRPFILPAGHILHSIPIDKHPAPIKAHPDATQVISCTRGDDADSLVLATSEHETFVMAGFPAGERDRLLSLLAAALQGGSAQVRVIGGAAVVLALFFGM